MSFRWQLALFAIALALVAIVMWQPIIGLMVIVLTIVVAINIAVRRTS